MKERQLWFSREMESMVSCAAMADFTMEKHRENGEKYAVRQTIAQKVDALMISAHSTGSQFVEKLEKRGLTTVNSQVFNALVWNLQKPYTSLCELLMTTEILFMDDKELATLQKHTHAIRDAIKQLHDFYQTWESSDHTSPVAMRGLERMGLLDSDTESRIDGDETLDQSMKDTLKWCLRERRSFCVEHGNASQLRAYLQYEREIRKLLQTSKDCWRTIPLGVIDGELNPAVYTRFSDHLVAMSPAFGMQQWEPVTNQWKAVDADTPLFTKISAGLYAELSSMIKDHAPNSDRYMENTAVEYFLKFDDSLSIHAKHEENNRILEVFRTFNELRTRLN